MKQQEFRQYQAQTIARFNKLLGSATAGTFDEQALPAYTNNNPAMRWLFWQRVAKVIDFVEQSPALDKVLDFGCGLGAMIPFLDSQAQQIVALDLDTSLLQKLGADLKWRKVQYRERLEALLPAEENSFDLVLAMDVLEHVDNLEATLNQMEMLLKPDGVLIVTGPTENGWYKLGRRLAGYHGDYHQRNIYDIIQTMQLAFRVEPLATLYPFLPLFVIVTGQPKNQPVRDTV